MMFDRKHFCSKLTTTTTTTEASLIAQSVKSGHVKTAIKDQFNVNSSQTIGVSSNNNNRDQPRVGKTAILFNLPLRRFIIALVTLRLTSTSTSTATTVSSSAIGSLATLIKSLLIGCYYLLAFTSLLMLILYIDHVTSQTSAFNTKTIKIAEPKLKPVELLSRSTPEAMLAGQVGIGSQDRSRIKRSTILSLRNQTKLHRQSTRIKQVDRTSPILKTPTSAIKGSVNNPPPVESPTIMARKVPSRAGTVRIQRAGNNQLPKLLERQASSGRTSNVQNRTSYLRTHQASESQWIPITVNRLEPHPTPSYTLDLSHRTPTKVMNPSGNSQHPTSTGPIFEAPSYRQATVERPRHLHDPDEGRRFHQGRHWRRPRLNVQAQDNRPYAVYASKMYKRVLLCDKTLVSLDYIKNLDLEPRPYGGPPSSPSYGGHVEFDDNVIDFDNDLENFFPDRRSGSVANGSVNELAPSASIINRRNDLVSYDISGGINERRSYFSDQDPLVRCDMWDLEKGIKNRKPPKDILQMAVKADFDTVRDAINRCRQLSEKTYPSEDEYRDELEIMSTEDLLTLFSMKRGLIPGTKWCGLGDQASSYNDLGPKHRIDICCRAHDHCPIRLKPFRNDYGVLNIALYTKSHCDCDADFYRCLREVHSRTADMLGNLYFNVMKLQCMREERMKVCREMKPIALGFERCVRYEDSPVKTVFRFTTPLVAY